MPRVNTLLIVFCALLLSACGVSLHRRIAAVLDDVESYINERPDRALAVLQELDSTRIRTLGTKAHYYLLLAIARDKNNQDDGHGLSGMEPAVAWYRRHGSLYDQTRACYYLADMQHNAGLIAEATVNYTRAFELAVDAHPNNTYNLSYSTITPLFLHYYICRLIFSEYI